MPCPFFEPRVRMGEGPLDPAPRLPLIEAWSGACQIDGSEPPEQEQRDVCNTGYARGRCCKFPKDTEADAVRFSARRDTAGVLRVVYVLEKDCAPVRHGEINFSSGEPDGSTLAAQARAYVASHLGR